ncbi:MAG: PmoA family protein [Planctomycetota bacterium]
MWTILGLMLWAGPCSPQEDVRLTIEGLERDIAAVPVVYPIGVRVDPDTQELLDENSQPVPFQTDGAGESTHLHWIARDLVAGQPKTYRLAPRRSGPRPALPEKLVHFREENGEVEVLLSETPFTRVHLADDAPRPYLFPVEAFGHRVTRSWPMEKGVAGENEDHPHHKSIWFSYGDIDGVDYWADPSGDAPRGRILHRELLDRTEGPVYARLVSRQEWVAPDDSVRLEGVEELRFYLTPENPIIDLTMTLTAVTQSVRIGDTKEGMMAIRVHPGLKAQSGGTLSNSGNLVGERALWGKPARWCDMSGKIGEDALGITLMDHPESFRHPTRWHARGYGLLAANPFGLSYFVDKSQDGGITLEKGESVRFRYRILIHRGDAAGGAVDQMYRLWARPSVRRE